MTKTFSSARALTIAMLIATGAAGAQSASTGAKKSAGATKSTATKSAAAPATFDKSLLNPAALNATAPAEYDVKFTTTKGDIVIHVTREWSPNGADRFYNLVRHHFYDNTAFFRNIKGFMVQFGMSAYPEVNKVWMHADIKDDAIGKQSNKPGYVTFAKTSAPNSRSTQIFINHGNNAGLDSQGFTPFGVVTTGLDVVEQLYDGGGQVEADQDQIRNNGKKYLDAAFPKLDWIKTGVVVGAPAATPAKSGTGSKSSGAKKGTGAKASTGAKQ